MTTLSTPTNRDLTHLLTECEVAERLSTTIDSIRWMRRKHKLRFVKIAGNRKVRFLWAEVLEDISSLSSVGK